MTQPDLNLAVHLWICAERMKYCGCDEEFLFVAVLLLHLGVLQGKPSGWSLATISHLTWPIVKDQFAIFAMQKIQRRHDNNII